MKRIRKNDEITVIAGKDKGRNGKVLEVDGDRVIVESINMVKKTVKPNPDAGETGGIKDKEQSIHISNVMLFNPSSKKRDRLGFRMEGDTKVRYFKSDGKKVQ